MPKDIDRIRFEVTQGMTLRTEDHLLGPGQFLMPAEFRLKPLGNSEPVLIRAIGYKAGIARIERSVITSIPSDFLAMVRLPLSYLCAGTARDDDTSTCGDQQTCKVGLCQSAVVEASTLPTYAPGPWSGAESGKRDPSANECFDVLSCFTQAFRVTVEKETCTFVIDNDDPANISVGIKLPQGSDGICGGGTGACWIALDQGPEGWTNNGTIFMLPPALCRDNSDGSKLVIVASNMCGGKTLSTPTCGDWSSATHPIDTSESIGMMDDSQIETPGTPVGLACAGLSFQPCGDCGQQRRTCKNGSWSEWGECLGQGVCTPNASESCGADGMRVCLSTCDWGECTGQTCAGMAVEACGNCGTRRRTCANGEWSEWGQCENSGQCAPGTTQACGVDGTQACMGNCQWGVCGMQSCDGAPSQACGNCGTQTRGCDEATQQWSAFGACAQEGPCEANQTRACGLRGMQTCGGNCQWDAACAGQVCEGPASQPCGMCGIQSRVCDSTTGVWSGWSACSNEGACVPGSTQACGVGGKQTCLASCMWNDECTGQVCEGPMTRSCGSCGSESRSCDGSTASWSPFSACQNQGPCTPGSSRRCGSGGTQTCLDTCQWPAACTGQSCSGESTQPCGDCGTQTRTCDGSKGQWSAFGACSNQGPCTPGETAACGALKSRTCLDTCQFDQCDCDPGATACGDLCVNLQTDSAHCGSCNNSCDGRPCDNGVCRKCDGGFHNCNGTCRRNDDVNWCGDSSDDCKPCGSIAGAPSGSVPTCPGGTCGWACPAGTIVCGSASNPTCTPNTTTSNCGSCGNTCMAGESCENLSCTCPGGGRLNTAENCKTCGVACNAPANSVPKCTDRTCDFTCNSGFFKCGDRCGSNDDETACGRSCDVCTGSEQCINGACGCANGTLGDSNNCGGCGMVCPSGEACRNNTCACPKGMLGDANNCGSCGNACPRGESCNGGACSCPGGGQIGTNADCAACGDVCSKGETCNGGACSCPGGGQLGTNANCGSCGDACSNGETCNGGACSCPGGGQLGTNANCGSCGNACPRGESCNGETCSCPGGGQIGTNADCGSCGDACSNGETCNGGACSCPGGGQTGTNANCGSCGDVCSNGETCKGGACSCPNGQLGTNANCGSCGNACPRGESCNDGACGCPGGGQIGTNANCGSCGDACASGETCSNGACSCPGGGQTGTNANCASCGDTCGNGETCRGNQCSCPSGMLGDANNCGSCGTRCDSGQACKNGECACQNGSLGDNRNCGACGMQCPTGEQCLNNSCACPEGKLGDNNNCGACGAACDASERCNAGNCVCKSGSLGDADNCGSCGNACPGGNNARCNSGQCGCAANTCGANCQTCRNSETCTNGACVPAVSDVAGQSAGGQSGGAGDDGSGTGSGGGLGEAGGQSGAGEGGAGSGGAGQGGAGEGGAGSGGAGEGGAGEGGAGEGGAGEGGAGSGGAGESGSGEELGAGSGDAGQSGPGENGRGRGRGASAQSGGDLPAF
jgi:hypothetical protein